MAVRYIIHKKYIAELDGTSEYTLSFISEEDSKIINNIDGSTANYYFKYYVYDTITNKYLYNYEKGTATITKDSATIYRLSSLTEVDSSNNSLPADWREYTIIEAYISVEVSELQGTVNRDNSNPKEGYTDISVIQDTHAFTSNNIYPAYRDPFSGEWEPARFDDSEKHPEGLVVEVYDDESFRLVTSGLITLDQPLDSSYNPNDTYYLNSNNNISNTQESGRTG